jgi:hypothetical protein
MDRVGEIFIREKKKKLVFALSADTFPDEKGRYRVTVPV